LAQTAVERAVAWRPHPQDERVLASLLYDRAGICEALGAIWAAKDAAERAWQIYDRLDPTRMRPSEIGPVLAAARTPVVVTDYRTVRAVVEHHKRVEQQTEQAIAHAADAWIRVVRLEALCGGKIEDAQRIRERGSWAINIYRELIRVGHLYGPADLARVEAEYAAAQEAQKGEPTYRSDLDNRLTR
jgi:hypothetical protein